MIMKKKWDEKGKKMQFEVKTRDGKSTFYRKTRKKVIFAISSQTF